MAKSRGDAPTSIDPSSASWRLRLLTRIIDAQLELVLIAAGLFALFCGWAIYKKTSEGLGVPSALVAELATALGVLAVEGVAWLVFGRELHALRNRRRLTKDAQMLLREARQSLDVHSDRLKPAEREQIAFLAKDLE